MKKRSLTRIDLLAIFDNPEHRKELIVKAAIALQAREGRDVSYEDMSKAYDVVMKKGDSSDQERNR